MAKLKPGRGTKAPSPSGEWIQREVASGRTEVIVTPRSSPKRQLIFERMTKTGVVNVPAGRAFAQACFVVTEAAQGDSKKVSVRVPESLLEEARKVSGIDRDADLIKAGLAALAKPNAFGAWLIASEGALPEDFDLDV